MTVSQNMAPSEKYQVRLPLFEGPLDLLLHLIEQEELDITRVALAQVTDQFLSYLSVLTEVRVENLSDFLVVAARLLLIKSQALLPRPPSSLEENEEDLGDQLARQLQQYKRYRQVAEQLSEWESAQLRSYLRLAPPPKMEPKLALGAVTLHELLLAARDGLAVFPSLPDVDEVLSPLTVTIGDQMGVVCRALTQQGEVSLQVLLGEAGRVEIIVTLMAVLELIKQHVVDVRQDVPFGEVIIFGVGSSVSNG